ncbi:MAG TPA: hypothetical protein VFW40_12960 [Capsulimonadaceae bacterium]|nr:hypothetical protein [Capsulimonadaceae bacterium]
MKTLLTVLTALLIAIGTVYAASDTAQQTIAVHVESEATLSLDSPTVTFPSDNPSLVSKIDQLGTVNIEARARTSDSGDICLTALAASDLKSGSDIIPIGAMSWDATGLGYSQIGILSDTQAQLLGSWNHSGIYDGAITYLLDNEWDYAAGTYSTTVTYTLTAL